MIKDIEAYQLFLFDLDGLLVNTEKLHWKAYITTCKDWGHELKWDFEKYSSIALTSAEGLRLALEAELVIEDWDRFYAQKKENFVSILEKGPVELMPGVRHLLEKLYQLNKTTCVVTHSVREFTVILQNKLPALRHIQHWVTREDYKEPKPMPDGYQLAIERYSKGGDRIIGFEDSPRGLEALRATAAKPVFVSNKPFPDVENLPGVMVLRHLGELIS